MSAAVAAGLRALADWMDAHPNLPDRKYAEQPLRILWSVDTPEHVEVAAALVGAPLDRATRGTTLVTLYAGPVVFEVYHLPDDRMTEHIALQTYAGAVRP